ncbi:MAG: hypothetical protein JJU30_13255 [Alkalimonas sp.]|nr:hypothetical protein [Alkalimonas sp.]
MRTLIAVAGLAGLFCQTSQAECTILHQSATELHYKAFATANQALPNRNFVLQFQVRCTEPLQSLRVESLSAPVQVFLASHHQQQPLPTQSIELQVQLRDFRGALDGQHELPLQLTSELHTLQPLQPLQPLRLDINYQVAAIAGMLSPGMHYSGELMVQVQGQYHSIEAEQLRVPLRLVFNPAG